jgi:hypothetical protein
MMTVVTYVGVTWCLVVVRAASVVAATALALALAVTVVVACIAVSVSKLALWKPVFWR